MDKLDNWMPKAENKTRDKEGKSVRWGYISVLTGRKRHGTFGRKTHNRMTLAKHAQIIEENLT